jgi:hypothetical protein
LPDVVVLDGEKYEPVGVWSKKWFGGKASVGFVGLVFRYWVGRVGGGSGFLCDAGCVVAKFVPVVTVVADEVGDFAEGFVGNDGYCVWRGA